MKIIYYIIILSLPLLITSCRNNDENIFESDSSIKVALEKENAHQNLAKKLSDLVVESEKILLRIIDDESAKLSSQEMQAIALEVTEIANKLSRMPPLPENEKKVMTESFSKQQVKLDELVQKREQHAKNLSEDLSKQLYDINWKFRLNWRKHQEVFSKHFE